MNFEIMFQKKEKANNLEFLRKIICTICPRHTEEMTMKVQFLNKNIALDFYGKSSLMAQVKCALNGTFWNI
jgi:hypothetical protein